MTDPVQIRAYRPGDETGILAAYNKVFPTPDGKIQPRSLAHWKWKFEDNPAGVIHVVIAEHETEGVVGSYVTMPARIWIEGKPALAGQPIDLFVLPEWRRHGARPGLFVHCAHKHYELWSGLEEGKNVFHYGWPVPNWRIGQKYLKYENVRDWDFLFRELATAPVRAVPAGLEVRIVPRLSAEVDALWELQKNELQLALIRDQRYLNWRYADAHDRSYVLMECREKATGRLRGISVYTQSDFLIPGSAYLVEWLCPIDDHDAMHALVAAGEERGRRDGAHVLATLFPQMNPRFLMFQRLGFLVYGSNYFTVVAPFDARGTLFYREQWYHTCGDSDLV